MRQHRAVLRRRLYETEHLATPEKVFLTMLLAGGGVILVALPFALTGNAYGVVWRAFGFLFAALSLLPLMWALAQGRGRLQPVTSLGLAGGTYLEVFTWVTGRPFA